MPIRFIRCYKVKNMTSTTTPNQTSKLVPPHGSKELKPLLLKGEARHQALKLASTLPTIALSSRERGDLIMLGIGGFTPLNGFMNQADWQWVVDDMRLQSGDNAGLFFPNLIPWDL